MPEEKGRVLRALVAFVVISVVVSCALTPLVYSAIIAVLGQTNLPYSRVFDRVIMVVALITLICMRRKFSLDDLVSRIKEGSIKERVKRVAAGLVLSLLLVACVFPVILITAPIDMGAKSGAEIVFRILGLIPAAIVIGFIEECFFRVLLLGWLRRLMNVRAALILCSLVYASLHFIIPYKKYVYPGYSPLVGFEYLGIIFSRMFTTDLIWPFAGLFLAGMVLGIIYLRTYSLYLCIGIHAGWIIAVKLTKFGTIFTESVFTGSTGIDRYVLVSFPITWLAILLVLPALIFFRVFAEPRKEQ